MCISLVNIPTCKLMSTALRECILLKGYTVSSQCFMRVQEENQQCAIYSLKIKTIVNDQER